MKLSEETLYFLAGLGLALAKLDTKEPPESSAQFMQHLRDSLGPPVDSGGYVGRMYDRLADIVERTSQGPSST